MGVRLYNPAAGRFLSTDPVYGGNANAYDYCSGDAANCADTSGAFSCHQTGFHTTYKSSWGGVVKIPYRWDWYFRCDFSHAELTRLEAVTTVTGALGILANLGKGIIAAIAGGPWGIAITIASAVTLGAAIWFYNASCTSNKGAHIDINLRVNVAIPSYSLSGHCN